MSCLARGDAVPSNGPGLGAGKLPGTLLYCIVQNARWAAVLYYDNSPGGSCSVVYNFACEELYCNVQVAR